MLTIVNDILKRAARTINFSQIMRHMFRTQLSHKFSDLSNLRAWAITTAKVNYAEAFTYAVSQHIYRTNIRSC